MTIRQRVLKLVYPLLMLIRKRKPKILNNSKGIVPSASFYSLGVQLNSGAYFSFEQLRGKKILLVTTASHCGYTHQYKDLQELHEQQKDNLVIIGFPSNDFKEQEKGTDEEIAQFCSVNYGVQFPLAKKSSVNKGPEQHPVFQWLSDSHKNGWNNQPPEWNFSKYLINEQGVLTHYFHPAVSPLSANIKKAIA